MNIFKIVRHLSNLPRAYALPMSFVRASNGGDEIHSKDIPIYPSRLETKSIKTVYMLSLNDLGLIPVLGGRRFNEDLINYSIALECGLSCTIRSR